VTPLNIAVGYQRFGEICCLNLHLILRMEAKFPFETNITYRKTTRSPKPEGLDLNIHHLEMSNLWLLYNFRNVFRGLSPYSSECFRVIQKDTFKEIFSLGKRRYLHGDTSTTSYPITGCIFIRIRFYWAISFFPFIYFSLGKFPLDTFVSEMLTLSHFGFDPFSVGILACIIMAHQEPTLNTEGRQICNKERWHG